MRQFSKCQHHPRTDCACARRSHSCPAGRIPGGESERKRKTDEICGRGPHIFQPKGTSGPSKPGAAFQRDMVSVHTDDVGTPPRLACHIFSSLCAALSCELTFHWKGRGFAKGLAWAFIPHTPNLVWFRWVGGEPKNTTASGKIQGRLIFFDVSSDGELSGRFVMQQLRASWRA